MEAFVSESIFCHIFYFQKRFFRNLTFFPGGRFCLGNGFFFPEESVSESFFFGSRRVGFRKGLFFAV